MKISEQGAYDAYVKACHANVGEWVSEFNFNEWRAMGRPAGLRKSDGMWPTPWPANDAEQP